MRARVAALVALSALALALSPFIGPGLQADSGAWVLWQLRLPRALLGLLVGATLGTVGAAFQAVFENPLATPSTVGTTAGAALGALAVLVLVPSTVALGTPLVAVGAFVGAIGVSLGLAALARSNRLRTEDLLLAGIAATLAAGAMTSGLQLVADEAATFQAMRWSLGSLSTVGYSRPLFLLPFSLLCIVAVLWQTPALEAMVAGQDRAASQGVDVVRVRTLVLGLGSLGVAAAVAACGPIAFVGLMVPHLVRGVVGGSRRRVLPLSAVVGGALLPLADGVARILVTGRELPVGVLTAAMGAPLLLALLIRRRDAG
jgi:iron complex transport system permease protein